MTIIRKHSMKCDMSLPASSRICLSLHAKCRRALVALAPPWQASKTAPPPARSSSRPWCCCRRHASTVPDSADSGAQHNRRPDTGHKRSSQVFTRSNALYFDQIKTSPFHAAQGTDLKRDPVIPGRHLDGKRLHRHELDALRSLEAKLAEYQARDEPHLLLRDARAYVDYGTTPLSEHHHSSNRRSSRGPTIHLIPTERHKGDPPPSTRTDQSPTRPASLALYHGVLWALSKSASPDHALCVLEEMPRMGIPRDATAWTHYIGACAANRDPERIRQALLAAEHVDAIMPTSDMLEATLVGYVHCAELDRAMAIVRRLRRAQHERIGAKGTAVGKEEERNRHYLSWETLGLLLQRLVVARRKADVAEVFAGMRVGLVQDQPAVWWAELVRVFAEANFTEHAKQAFTRLLQLAPPPPPPTSASHNAATSTLDEGTLTAMLDLAARSADPILAAHVLKVMTSFQITPTEHHFCSLVLSFGRARDFKSVIYMLALMRKAGFNPHNAAHSVLQPMLNLPLDASAATAAAGRADATNSSVRGGSTVTAPADLIDVPPNLQRPIATVTQWRAASLLLPVLKDQARFAIDASAMAMLINNARILQIDDLGLDLYRQRAALGVPLDLELAHAALSCSRGSVSGDREQVLADMQRVGLKYNERTYELLIRLTLGDLVAKRAEALMETMEICTLEHLEQRLEQHDGMYTDHDETYPARVAYANFDASAWLDRAVGYLDAARRDGCVSSRQCVYLLRSLARFGDARWKEVAAEIVRLGYFVDSRTVGKVVERYPNDEVTMQLAQLTAARVRRPRRSGSGSERDHGRVGWPAARQDSDGAILSPPVC